MLLNEVILTLLSEFYFVKEENVFPNFMNRVIDSLLAHNHFFCNIRIKSRPSDVLHCWLFGFIFYVEFLFLLLTIRAVIITRHYRWTNAPHFLFLLFESNFTLLKFLHELIHWPLFFLFEEGANFRKHLSSLYFIILLFLKVWWIQVNTRKAFKE